MTLSPTTSADRPGRLAAALVLLVVAAMGIVIGNQLVQDDLPIIANNAVVHHPTLAVFTTPYWPWPYSPDLYRPLSTLLFSLEWRLGGGQPVAVHLASLLLYAGCVLAVWRLARRLLEPAGAFVAAALFAVHPVHVEVVSVGVNQSEILVATLLALATADYIDARRTGTLSARRGAGLLLLYVAACLIKEHAIVLPGLLIGAELTVLRTAPRPARWRDLRVLLLLFVLVAELFLIVRTLVLRNFAGTFTAEGLKGLDLAGRTATMLGVVPEWVRLLFWPAHLRADYSPQELVGHAEMTAASWVGLALVLATLAIVAATWRRRPALAFGLLWFGAAMLPVANVLIPTGIVLAERILFLPSVGVMLAVGAGVAPVRAAVAAARPGIRRLALFGAGVLLMAAIARSAERVTVWNNVDYLWLRTIEDAPLSYRANHAVAQQYFAKGKRGTAEQYFRRAIALYPRASAVYFDLGDRYRLADICGAAIEPYEKGLEIHPGRSDVRASLAACLLWLGRYQAARSQARIARGWGGDPALFLGIERLADSGLAGGIPAGSLRVAPTNPLVADSLLRVGGAWPADSTVPRSAGEP